MQSKRRGFCFASFFKRLSVFEKCAAIPGRTGTSISRGSLKPTFRDPTMSTPRILMLILVATLFAACGNKGALYLPDKSSPPPPAQEETRP
jgi:predicted small lipoprotein YifL